MAPERPSRPAGTGLPGARDSASPTGGDEPSREEVQRRVSALYDQAETATGNYNATRARNRGRRTGVDLALGETPSARRDPVLESVTRQWFDLARAQLGPTVPAVLPSDRRPNPAGTRSAAPARRPAGELTASGTESEAPARLALPAGPSATAPALPQPAAGPDATAASTPEPVGPAAIVPSARELTAGPALTAPTASTATVLPKPTAEPALASAPFIPEPLTSAPPPAPWPAAAVEAAATVPAAAGTRPETAAARPPSVARPRPEVSRSAKERLQQKMDQARELLARHAGLGDGPASGIETGPAAGTWYAAAPEVSRLTSQQLLGQWTQQPAAFGTGGAPDESRAWSGTAMNPGQPAGTLTNGAALDTAALSPGVPDLPHLPTGPTATAPFPSVPAFANPAADPTTALFATVPAFPQPAGGPTTTAPFSTDPAFPDPAATPVPATPVVPVTTAPLGIGDVGGTPYERKTAKALAFARAQVGKPCVWGATGPDSYDCSSLTQAAWRAAGVDLPRTAAGQAGCGTPVALAEMQAGDLILFHGDVSHVGLCTGSGLMIHAPGPGAPIREESIFFAGAQAIHSAVRPA
ncbi:C40 family peptidase [Streptomyces sp. NPDC003697]